MKSYTYEFRSHVIETADKENLTHEETAKRFNISMPTVKRWLIDKRSTLERHSDALKDDVIKFPQRSIAEHAKKFNLSKGGILYTFKKLGIKRVYILPNSIIKNK